MSHQIKVEDFIHDEFTGLLASGDGKRLESVLRVFANGTTRTVFSVTNNSYKEYFSTFSKAFSIYNST